VNLLDIWGPVPKVFLRLVQDLARRFLAFVGWVAVTGDDWGVVQEVEDTSSLLGK